MPVHVLRADAVDTRVGPEFSDCQPGSAGHAPARLSCGGRPSLYCHLCGGRRRAPVCLAGGRVGVNESISTGLAPARRLSSPELPSGAGDRFAGGPVPACGMPVGGVAPAPTASIPQAMFILPQYSTSSLDVHSQVVG